jgi:hypothetical protein
LSFSATGNLLRTIRTSRICGVAAFAADYANDERRQKRIFRLSFSSLSSFISPYPPNSLGRKRAELLPRTPPRRQNPGIFSAADWLSPFVPSCRCVCASLPLGLCYAFILVFSGSGNWKLDRAG